MDKRNGGEKELKRLEQYRKQLARPKTRFTVFMMFALIILVHLLDTYTSDISNKVQSSYLNEFLILGRGFTEEAALQYVSILGIFTVLFALLAPFYKSLMDVIGRRMIFILNILGMCGGLFVCYIAPSMEVMLVGMILISFFILHDMQMIYVYEVAPPKWRSTVYFTCKFIGVFGTLAIPLMRSLYMTESSNNWRPLYLLPAVCGFAVFLLAIVFMRESDVYLKSQIDYLNTPADERTKDKKGNSTNKVGIGPAIRLCTKNRQLGWLIVSAVCLFSAMVGVVQNYEAFMNYYGNMTAQEITFALTVQIIVMGLIQFVSGFLADLLGRKVSTVVFTVLTVVTLVLFVFLTPIGLAPWLVGVLLGLLIGCFWNVTDLNGMMLAESAPTKLRGSIAGVNGLALVAGMLISMVANVALLSFTNLGVAKLVVGIPGVVLSALIIVFKTKETKGTDLEKIELGDAAG